MAGRWRDRDHVFHEMEHVVLIILVGVVLVQAAMMTGEEAGGDSGVLVIIPSAEEFSVGPGTVIEYPWLVVNAKNHSTHVTIRVQMDWERELERDGRLPPGVTAMTVADPFFVASRDMGSGEHQQFLHRFRTPERPGEYRLTIIAETEQQRVNETVRMIVVQ